RHHIHTDRGSEIDDDRGGTEFMKSRKQLTIRSAPTSFGCLPATGCRAYAGLDQHMRYRRPVLVEHDPDFVQHRGNSGQGGAPVSRSESSPISPSIVSASSSAVISDSVRIRHCCTTFALSLDPEINPTTCGCCGRRLRGARLRGDRSSDASAGTKAGSCPRSIAGCAHRRRRSAAGSCGLRVVHGRVGDEDHQITGMHEMGCGAVDSDNSAAALPGIA
ncbi:hypothetical protein I552_0081, partial [Mycobacterium xenopi 3993]